ncbi:MAG: WcbI family polysaccharide biosynthesis putative acetyltransferase [Desulfovibrionaceae bacterium]|nr:WcbI family polysaccharide biosynthesis putative acetyltransferase [Desulfovibrionaceae bacterium]
MSRELCLIHANCQGDSLRSLLAATPAFARCFEIRKYTNYLKESIPQQDFDCCRVFLYQHLGEKWDDLASDALLARLHPVTCGIQLPNLFFTGYWPLWTNKSTMNYGDILLDLLVSRGYSESEALHVYLRGRLAEKYPLNALLSESLFRARRKEKGAVIALTDFIEDTWRARQLFLTPNHPDKALLLAVADAVLETLGLGRVPPSLRSDFTPEYPDFELPIHPQVGAHFGLPFAGVDRLYSIYGRPMNFARYAACYVHCLSRRLGNFEAFLHLVPAA